MHPNPQPNPPLLPHRAFAKLHDMFYDSFNDSAYQENAEYCLELKVRVVAGR